MDYKNKFYEILKRMSDNCINCDCDSCIFDIYDKCCIEDLFTELSYVSPLEYEEIYIKWYQKWEVKYNELYN